MKKLITILILILISFSINAQNELADVNIYTTLYIDASNKTAEQLYNKTMNYISNLPYSINEIDKNKQITLCLEAPFPDVTSMKEYIIKLNFRDNRIELNINLTVAERKKIEKFFNIHLIDYVYYLNK